MSVKEIEDKKIILHTLEKDELISYIHELLVHIKKSKSKKISEKGGVRFLERQLSKIRDQIDKVLKTKVSESEIWAPPITPNITQPITNTKTLPKTFPKSKGKLL